MWVSESGVGDVARRLDTSRTPECPDVAGLSRPCCGLIPFAVTKFEQLISTGRQSIARGWTKNQRPYQERDPATAQTSHCPRNLPTPHPGLSDRRLHRPSACPASQKHHPRRRRQPLRRPGNHRLGNAPRTSISDQIVRGSQRRSPSGSSGIGRAPMNRRCRLPR